MLPYENYLAKIENFSHFANQVGYLLKSPELVILDMFGEMPILFTTTSRVSYSQRSLFLEL